MCFIFSLVPATFVVVWGYFVLFSSTKTEGGVRKFGKVLAIWIFVIASLFPAVGAFVTITGQCPMEEMMMKHNGDVIEK